MFRLTLSIYFIFAPQIFLQTDKNIEWKMLYGPPGGDIAFMKNNCDDNVFIGSDENNSIWFIGEELYKPILISDQLIDGSRVLDVCQTKSGRILAIVDGYFPKRIYFTDDSGQNWNGSLDKWLASMTAIFSDSGETILFGLNIQGKIYFSENEGINWSLRGEISEVEFKWPLSILSAGKILYVNFGHNSYYSLDSGFTFQKLDLLNQIDHIDENRSGFKFALSNNKLFLSANGVEWNQCTNVDQFNIHSFTILNSDQLVISTIDNGLIYTDSLCSNWSYIDPSLNTCRLVRYNPNNSNQTNYLLLKDDDATLYIGDLTSANVGNLGQIGLLGDCRVFATPNSDIVITTNDNHAYLIDYSTEETIFLRHEYIPQNIYSIIQNSKGQFFYSTSNEIFRVNEHDWQNALLVFSRNGYNFELFMDKMNNLYASSSVEGKVYRSGDLGESWDQIVSFGLFDGLESNNVGEVFAVGGGLSPFASKYFFSADSGHTWQVTNFDSIYASFTSIAMTSDNTLFIGGERNGIYELIYTSTDKGQTWDTFFEKGTEEIIIHLIVNSEDEIYSFSKSGITLFNKNGDTWSQYFLNKPPGFIKDVGIDRSGYLYVSPLSNRDEEQYGKGVYRSSGIITSKTLVLKQIASDFILFQNYPNPFNPTTVISYQIAAAGDLISVMPERKQGVEVYKQISLKVFDLLGREIATLVNENQKPGNYQVAFDPSSYGLNLASGIYFYRLQTGNYAETKKMILLQ